MPLLDCTIVLEDYTVLTKIKCMFMHLFFDEAQIDTSFRLQIYRGDHACISTQGMLREFRANDGVLHDKSFYGEFSMNFFYFFR